MCTMIRFSASFGPVAETYMVQPFLSAEPFLWIEASEL